MNKVSEDFMAMIERQINIGRMFQVRGATAIQNMDLTNLPPRFLSHAVELVKVGVSNASESARLSGYSAKNARQVAAKLSIEVDTFDALTSSMFLAYYFTVNTNILNGCDFL